MSTLSSRPENIVSSGISKIQYIETGDIEYVISKFPENNRIEVEPKNGKTWSEIYFTPKTVKINHTIQKTSAGEIHEYNIVHHIPYNRLSAAQNISQLQNRTFYLKLIFLNGNARIFGEPDNVMKFQATEEIGVSPLTPDGYNINWYGKFSRPASYDFKIHSIITPDPLPPDPPPTE
jgi:hypothetical protein